MNAPPPAESHEKKKGYIEENELRAHLQEIEILQFHPPNIMIIGLLHVYIPSMVLFVKKSQ